MTEEEFINKIEEMLQHDDGIVEVIRRGCLSAIKEQYVKDHYLAEAENNFIFTKIVLCAVFRELAWQYEPLTRSDKLLVNILHSHVKVTK